MSEKKVSLTRYEGTRNFTICPHERCKYYFRKTCSCSRDVHIEELDKYIGTLHISETQKEFLITIYKKLFIMNRNANTMLDKKRGEVKFLEHILSLQEQINGKKY